MGKVKGLFSTDLEVLVHHRIVALGPMGRQPITARTESTIVAKEQKSECSQRPSGHPSGPTPLTYSLKAQLGPSSASG